MKFASLLVAAFFVWTSTLSAGDTFSQLPDDGAWARFYVTVRGDSIPELNVELTISAVGKLQENGKDCRWIELFSRNVATGERINVVKLLVPEANLKEGPFGPSDALRAWIAQAEGQGELASGNALAPVGFLFPDTLSNLQRLETTERVDWQQGQLDCAVLTGQSQTTLGDQMLTIQHRYQLSDKVPFGLGGFRSELSFDPSGTKLTVEARLMDVGTGAMSVLSGL